MTEENQVREWIVTQDGRFEPQQECDCEACQREAEEGPEITVIFEDDPEGVCPVCGERIEKGEITVELTQWSGMYEGQEEDYPLCGVSRPVHFACMHAVIREHDDDENT